VQPTAGGIAGAQAGGGGGAVILVAEDDAAFFQVVRRHFHNDAIARQRLDAVLHQSRTARGTPAVPGDSCRGDGRTGEWIYFVYPNGAKPMKVKLAKWGNSLGVRVPKAAADAAGLKAGTEVDVVVEGRDLRIRPSISVQILSIGGFDCRNG
jgi:hypothetical protein